MIPRRKFLIGFLLILVAAGIFGWHQFQPAPADQASNLQRVRMALVNSNISTLAIVADKKGFFAEEGILIDNTLTNSSKISTDMLLANKVDFTVTADATINFYGFNPPPCKILAENYHGYDIAVFTKKDIGINSEKNFLGKRIGYLPGTASFLYWAYFIDRLNWNMKDFEMVPLQPPAMPSALTGGTIDAFVMWEPWGHNAIEKMPNGIVKFSDENVYHVTSMVYGRNDFIEKNPGVVKGLLRALIKAEEFANNNREKTVQIVSQYTKSSPEQMISYWDAYKFRVQINQDIIKKFVENDRMIKKHMPEYADKPTPDFVQYINPEPLRSVAPERVTGW
jgi:ABC-type nitrate/sulfonate/bicarbonate transport system substrate-binding protein